MLLRRKKMHAFFADRSRTIRLIRFFCCWGIASTLAVAIHTTGVLVASTSITRPHFPLVLVLMKVSHPGSASLPFPPLFLLSLISACFRRSNEGCREYEIRQVLYEPFPCLAAPNSPPF